MGQPDKLFRKNDFTSEVSEPHSLKHEHTPEDSEPYFGKHMRTNYGQKKAAPV